MIDAVNVLSVNECLEVCSGYEGRFGQRCTAAVVSQANQIATGYIQCWMLEWADVATTMQLHFTCYTLL